MTGTWQYSPQGDALRYNGPAQISFGPKNIMPMNVEVILQTIIEMVPCVYQIRHWTGSIKTLHPIPPAEFVKLISSHVSEQVNIRLPDGRNGTAYIEYLAITTNPKEVQFESELNYKEFLPGEVNAIVKLMGTGKPPYTKDLANGKS